MERSYDLTFRLVSMLAIKSSDGRLVGRSYSIKADGEALGTGPGFGTPEFGGFGARASLWVPSLAARSWAVS
jgi:hypothetical protein